MAVSNGCCRRSSAASCFARFATAKTASASSATIRRPTKWWRSRWVALLAGLGGVLFTLNIGVISPAMIGVVPSIEMVIWVAIGGRDSLIGAVLGTLLVNFAKDKVSSWFPEIWLYLMGALFVLAVTVMPNGIGGLFAYFTRKSEGEARKTIVIPTVGVVDDEANQEPGV